MYRHCLHHCCVFVLGSFSQKFSFVIYGTIGIVLYFYEVMEEVLLLVVYHKFVIGVLVYHEQTPGQACSTYYDSVSCANFCTNVQ